MPPCVNETVARLVARHIEISDELAQLTGQPAALSKMDLELIINLHDLLQEAQG